MDRSKRVKKELAMILLFVVCIGTFGLLAFAEKSGECEYDADYDADSDYIMNSYADCGGDYEYDCDDSNKDVYKGCSNSLWNRLISWLKGGSKRGGDIIAGSAVKSVMPTPDPAAAIGSLKKTVERVAGDDCEVTICWQDNTEVYCPYGHARCVQDYDDCRIIRCAGEEESDPSEYVYESDDSGDYAPAYDDYQYDTYVGDSSDSVCTEEYHDCYDDGVAVICKGEFTQCDDAFVDCVCGTRDDTDAYGETAKADIDTSESGDCTTGVYICERQTLTMAGDIVDSKVTCRGNFAQCSMIYGGCQCGDTDLVDFPIKKLGSDAFMDECDDEAYWCDWHDRKVACHMIQEDCNEKRNVCYRQDGVRIECQGSYDYCNKVYDNECLCGIEES